MTTTPGGEEPTDVEDEESPASADATDAGTAETARDQGEEFPDDEDVEGHMFGQLSGFTVTVNADSLNAFGVNNDTLFAGPGDDSRFDEISRRRKRF